MNESFKNCFNPAVCVVFPVLSKPSRQINSPRDLNTEFKGNMLSVSKSIKIYENHTWKTSVNSYSEWLEMKAGE